MRNRSFFQTQRCLGELCGGSARTHGALLKLLQRTAALFGLEIIVRRGLHAAVDGGCAKADGMHLHCRQPRVAEHLRDLLARRVFRLSASQV